MRFLKRLRRIRTPEPDAEPRVESGMLAACKCGADPSDFLLGPRGGSARNCQCPSCGNWYNLAWLPGLDRPLYIADQGQRTDIDLRATAPSSSRVQ